MTIDSSTAGASIGPQTNTLTSPSAACTSTTPTARFNSTITNTMNSDGGANDRARLNAANGNRLINLITEDTTTNGIQDGWITTFTLDNFSEALDGMRVFGSNQVMPQNSSDYVNWTVTWTGGDANFVQSTQPLQLYTCGSTSTLMVDGPVSSGVCFRFDNNTVEGETVTFPAGAANFQIQLPSITGLTVQAEVIQETTGNAAVDSINAEFFAIDFDGVNLDQGNCSSTTQQDAAAVAAAQAAQATAETAQATAEAALANAQATTDINVARIEAERARAAAQAALIAAQTAAAQAAAGGTPISNAAQAAIDAAVLAANAALAAANSAFQAANARAASLAAQNIPIFGPLGLLAMFSGLLWFGRRKRS